jgi:general stress protein 26
VANPTAKLDDRFSDAGAKPTPWDEARRAIDEAELFWISTVRADGRPHVTPLPTVWQDEALYFCTGAEEQKAVNLDGNPHCALTTGNNAWKVGLDVVVEGAARRVSEDARLQPLADAWRTKYRGDWDFKVRNGAFVHEAGEALVYEVRPTKVIAFAKGDFAQTSYRF